jgi:xylulokinase
MSHAAVGIDLGTTSTKGVLVAADGRVLATAEREATLSSPHPTWAEMDPEQWWSNTCAVLCELIAAADSVRIVAVGVSGMVPALVALGGDDRPLRPSIQQNDARTAREIDEAIAEFGQERFFERTGGSINQQVLAPKLRWLARHEPHVVQRAAWWCGSYDFIAHRLTGTRSVEHNWALESGLASIATGTWDPELVALAGIAPGTLPPVRASHDVVGAVGAAAAAATGLPAGIPVVAGVADHVASAFTAGVAAAGDLLVKFGGAGDVLYGLDTLVTDPRLFIDHHVVPGSYLLNGCMATSGSLVKWFVRTFAAEDVAEAARAGRSAYAYLDDAAADLAPGSDGLVVLPYFLGEKTPLHDPHARGTIVGLGLHHERRHVYRAVLEAVAFGFRHHVDVLADRGLPVRRVLASDGGAASDLWMQITADVLGQPIERVAGPTGASLGAAFVAGKSAGLFHDWSDIGRFVTTGRKFQPDPRATAVYGEFYALYRDTYERLRTLYPRLVDARSFALENGDR